MELSEQAKQVRRDYFKRYYQEHKEQIKENHRRYWERKVLAIQVNDDENLR